MLLASVTAQLDMDKDVASSTDVAIAGAACLSRETVLSEHVPWLRAPIQQLEARVSAAGFRSVRLYNDLVATAATVAADHVRDAALPASPWAGPCGVLGIGTGLAGAIIHPLPGNQALIAASEVGYAPLVDDNSVRFRDRLSIAGLLHAAGAADVDELPVVLRRLRRDFKYRSSHVSFDRYVREFNWLVALFVLANNLRILVLTGGVVSALRDPGILSEHGLRQMLVEAERQGTPFLSQCHVSIADDPGLAMDGLEILGTFAPEGSGRSEGPIILQFGK